MAAFEYERESTREDIAYKGGLIADGVYELVVDKFEFKDNKTTKGGRNAAITLKVATEGRWKNRLIFLNLTIKHPTNEKAQANARVQLDRLLEAMGFEDAPGDTEELIARPFVARVGETTPNPERPDPDFKPENRIELYFFPGDKTPEIGESPSPYRKTAPAKGRTASRPADNRDRDRNREEKRNEGNREDSRSEGRSRDRDEGRGRDSRDSRSDDRGGNRNDRDSGDRDGGRSDSRGGRDDSRDNSRGSDRPARGGNRDNPFSRDVDDDIPF